MSEYHFELKDIKGKEKKVADALSRRTHVIYEVTLSQTDANFNNKRDTRWMILDYYGPRIDYMFQVEGTFGPTSSQNFITHPTQGTQDIKRGYIPSRDTFSFLS